MSSHYDRAMVRSIRQETHVRYGGGVVAVHSYDSPYTDSPGKHPTTEVGPNGEKRSWRDGHSLKHLNRATRPSLNTGLLAGGRYNLTMLDFDASKSATSAEQWRFTRDALTLVLDTTIPTLKSALVRTRRPASVLLLARSDQPMTKLKVAGERGAVEVLADGQQCVIDGVRCLDDAGQPVRWEWHKDRAPWNTGPDELPVIPAARIEVALHYLTSSGVLGRPVLRPMNTATVAQGPRSALPATHRLHQFFGKHGDYVRPAIRELVEEIGAEFRAQGSGAGRHDAIVAIAGRLVLQKWTDEQALGFLVPLVNEHFGEGDWTGEIEAALRHARERDTARHQATRGATWPVR